MATVASWLRGRFSDRPAESTTAAAGSVGLLLALVLGGDNENLQTALVILLASLPAVVSYLTDLGRYGPDGRRPIHTFTQEIDELALRAVRRARLGDMNWAADLQTVEKLLNAEKKLLRQPGAKPSDSEANTLGPSGPPG